MKVCGSCQATNKDTSKFCNSCGTILENTCEKCGESVPSTSQFCHNCGTAISNNQRVNNSSQIIDEPQIMTGLGVQQLGDSNDVKNKDGFHKILKVVGLVYALVIAGIVGWYFLSDDIEYSGSKMSPEITANEAKVTENNGQDKAVEAQKKQAQNVKETQQAAVNRLMEFESVLKSMADDINAGSITPAMATGSFRTNKVQQITIDNETLNKLDNASRTGIQDMNNLQKERMNAMFDGLRGNTSRYADGGKMYDLFYSKLNQYKSTYGLQ